MSLTLHDLKAHLWNCAEILRGSAVDRTDWKAYILPLLFFKRLSDVWDEEYQAAVGRRGRRMLKHPAKDASPRRGLGPPDTQPPKGACISLISSDAQVPCHEPGMQPPKGACIS